MIVTLGGRFGGYGLYLLKGKPVFDYNLLDLTHYRWEGRPLSRGLLADALKPGKHTIVFDFKYDGPGPGKGGTGVLTVDGKELARKTIPHTIPLLMSDRRDLRRWRRIRARRWTTITRCRSASPGHIDKLTFNLGPEQLTDADRKILAERLARARD